ncbi:MAG: methionyl-tRNA formyltransferase [Kordia sp.]|nr:MAG: methionyl-tRNA formyltransferase [Kordia sp.]
MIENIQYNTERNKLIIPEYGRHLQKMVDHAIAIEDEAERNKVAKAIIDVMGNLNPHLRDVADFKHKLWDQLFIISDFKLDVDSPFDKPTREELAEKPERLPYPQNFPKYRFYGNNIKRMIDVALRWEEGDLKQALIVTIANHMKKCFLNWNKDTVDDAVIFRHLYELSDGGIDITTHDLELTDSSKLMSAKSRQNTNKPHSNKSYSHRSSNKNTNRKKY